MPPRATARLSRPDQGLGRRRRLVEIMRLDALAIDGRGDEARALRSNFPAGILDALA